LTTTLSTRVVTIGCSELSRQTLGDKEDRSWRRTKTPAEQNANAVDLLDSFGVVIPILVQDDLRGPSAAVGNERDLASKLFTKKSRSLSGNIGTIPCPVACVFR
jgi:hypothetical protein